ncbi:MAG: MoaD/ThiS family protein [Desulfomonilaceae bacterium]|nr:MoaD/ThiS family protein [Desulfomonilaceae bacterium]
MKIIVRPVGLIRRYVREEELDVPAGFTSRGLVRFLKIPGELKMVSLVNGRKQDLDEPLREGDEVRLITLLTGG